MAGDDLADEEEAGTDSLTWYELKKANRIVSFDWEKYDQANVVYHPAQMSGDEIRLGRPRRPPSAPVVPLVPFHVDG